MKRKTVGASRHSGATGATRIRALISFSGVPTLRTHDAGELCSLNLRYAPYTKRHKASPPDFLLHRKEPS